MNLHKKKKRYVERGMGRGIIRATPLPFSAVPMWQKFCGYAIPWTYSGYWSNSLLLNIFVRSILISGQVHKSKLTHLIKLQNHSVHKMLTILKDCTFHLAGEKKQWSFILLQRNSNYWFQSKYLLYHFWKSENLLGSNKEKTVEKQLKRNLRLAGNEFMMSSCNRHPCKRDMPH